MHKEESHDEAILPRERRTFPPDFLALIDYICQPWLAKIELTNDNAICAVVGSLALPEPEDGRIK